MPVIGRQETRLMPFGVSLVAALWAAAGWAHDVPRLFTEGPAHTHAPTLPDVDAVREQQERIEALAKALEEGGDLDALIGSPSDFEAVIETLDRDALEQVLRDAQADPQAWVSLGLEEETLQSLTPSGPEQGERPSFGDTRVLIFASFGIPAPSLKALMTDAQDYGAQVVMRGFVENSVAATTDAMLSTFGGETETMPMAIDPTLFRLFEVEAVPVVVVLHDALQPCDSLLCAEDGVPAHDRLAGNVPLAYALERIAREGDAGAETAALALEAGGR
jgi:conjugal transfer pilus assembly protein TrbC